MTPRTIGSRQMPRFAIGEAIELQTCAIAPSGLRTATAQFEGPRIITPSRTACPPIGWDTGSLCAAGAAGLLEPPLEALDPSAAVQELLLPGVERVAGGTDLDVQ